MILEGAGRNWSWSGGAARPLGLGEAVDGNKTAGVGWRVTPDDLISLVKQVDHWLRTRRLWL